MGLAVWARTEVRLTLQVRVKGSSVGIRAASSWKVDSSWKSFVVRIRAPQALMSRTLQGNFSPEMERTWPSTPAFRRKKLRFSLL